MNTIVASQGLCPMELVPCFPNPDYGWKNLEAYNSLSSATAILNNAEYMQWT
jgi:hypothetical protein